VVVAERIGLEEVAVAVLLVHRRRRAVDERPRPLALLHERQHAAGVAVEVAVPRVRLADAEVDDRGDVVGDGRQVARDQVDRGAADPGLLQAGLGLGVLEAGGAPHLVVLGEGDGDGQGDLPGDAGDQELLALGRHRPLRAARASARCARSGPSA
jgi:hypothetical protein